MFHRPDLGAFFSGFFFGRRLAGFVSLFGLPPFRGLKFAECFQQQNTRFIQFAITEIQVFGFNETVAGSIQIEADTEYALFFLCFSDMAKNTLPPQELRSEKILGQRFTFLRSGQIIKKPTES